MMDKKTNVLFNGHDFKFLTPFIDRCIENPLFEVKIDKHRGHDIDSKGKSKEYLEWADIVFCEWALGNAVWYSKNKKPEQFLVIRLHMQEIRESLEFLWKIDWAAVDKLILICYHTYDWMLSEFPELRDKLVVIYNPIDALGTLNVTRCEFSEFNLGLVGIVPRLKRFDLAIEIIEKLKRYDSRFTLKIKGHRPEGYPWMLSRKKEMAWYGEVYTKIENLPFKNSIIFDPQGPDMAQWYSQVGFILSTSDFEGSHQTIAEGMAAGCIPIIRRWNGADRIYPEKYCIETQEEAAQVILRLKSSAEIYQREVNFCRQYAQEKFDQKMICDQLEGLFTEYLERRTSQVPQCQQSVCSLRVLLLGYIPAGQHSGYRIRIEQEIFHLQEAGVDVQLACLHPPAQAKDVNKHREVLQQLGCAVHLVEIENFFDLSLNPKKVAKALQALEVIVEQQHIDIVHAEALYCAKIASFLRDQKPNIKLVYDCHGVSPEEEMMSGANARRIKDTEAWERRLLTGADLNIFVSDAMRQHFYEKYGRLTIPWRIVPCCVQEKFFAAADQSEDLIPPVGGVIIGYLGTLVAWQCAPEMFRMFGELYKADPSFYFSVLAPENDHARARDLLCEVEIPDHRYMVRQVPHNEVSCWLRQWDVGVLLRHDDTVNRVASPTKFGEYLAAGLPVLLTDGIGDFSVRATAQNVALSVSSQLLSCRTMPKAELDRIVDFVKRCQRERQVVAEKCRAYAREELYWPKKIRDMTDGYHSLFR